MPSVCRLQLRFNGMDSMEALDQNLAPFDDAEPKMFSAGGTMNTGRKKWLREAA
jgi:hypothetical protein